MHELGWWGTLEGWARAVGILFLVADLVLVVLAFRRFSREGLTAALRERLVVALGLLPLGVVLAGFTYAIPESKKVERCGGCHVMQPFVADLTDPKSTTLAAVHHQNNFAHGESCFACHSDYGLWGDVAAKKDGLGHIWHMARGSYELPIRIKKPYANERCLKCHGGARRYEKNENHPEEVKTALAKGEGRCLDCHGDIHPAPETRGPTAGKKASR